MQGRGQDLRCHKDAATGPTESRTSAGGELQCGPAPPLTPEAPARRKVTPAELALLASGQQLGGNTVYVGRGGRGAPASKWGNPFKVGPGCSRAEAINKFTEHYKEAGLREHLGELAGKVLLCHCGAQEACHADYLLARRALYEPRAVVDTPAAPAQAPGPSSTATPGAAADGVSEGWHGRGPSRCAQHIGGNKPFCGGGGLCSPGRWAPGKRNLPGNLANLKGELGKIFAEAVARASGGRDDPLGFVLKLAAGRLKECPFAEEDWLRARLAVQKAVGLPAAEDVVAEGQVFHLRLFAELLKFAGDPDWEYIGGLGDGVPLGVVSRLRGPQRCSRRRPSGAYQTPWSPCRERGATTLPSGRTWMRSRPCSWPRRRRGGCRRSPSPWPGSGTAKGLPSRLWG